MIGKFKTNGDRKDPQLDRPPQQVDFAALSREIEAEVADYAKRSPPPNPWDKATAASLDEVGMFRDLSLAELDRLLEKLNEEYSRVLARAKAFRANIERSHRVLEQEIMAHSERCRTAEKFFADFETAVVNQPPPIENKSESKEEEQAP